MRAGKLTFTIVYFAIFAFALVGEMLSQLTYRRRSLSEIKAGFGRTVLRITILVAVLTISTWVWQMMGWRTGKPIHLPHWAAHLVS
jgi:uncharacterized membrane protein